MATTILRYFLLAWVLSSIAVTAAATPNYQLTAIDLSSASVEEIVLALTPSDHTARPALRLVIQYQLDNYELSQPTRVSLDRLGQALQDAALQPFDFGLIGHQVDGMYGAELAKQNADAVKRHLQTAHRVEPERLALLPPMSELPADHLPPAGGLDASLVVIVTTGLRQSDS